MKKSKVPVDKVFYKGDNNITYKNGCYEAESRANNERKIEGNRHDKN